MLFATTLLVVYRSNLHLSQTSHSSCKFSQGLSRSFSLSRSLALFPPQPISLLARSLQTKAPIQLAHSAERVDAVPHRCSMQCMGLSARPSPPMAIAFVVTAAPLPPPSPPLSATVSSRAPFSTDSVGFSCYPEQEGMATTVLRAHPNKLRVNRRAR